MGSVPNVRPHAVCIPYPAQGHITPMLKLAKLLHSNYGFHITFVLNHYNLGRLLRSGALSPHLHMPGFRFESIPDGLPVPPGGFEGTQDVPEMCRSIMENNLVEPFREVVVRVNSDQTSPPVSCIVSDGVMSFTLDVAQEMGLPDVLFWTTSACGFMGYIQYRELIDRGITPFKDESQFKDEYLDAPLDWIPGMQNIRLRDLPSFLRTTDPDDVMLKFVMREPERAKRATAILLNTFDELERPVLNAMRDILPPIYTIGPLSLLSSKSGDSVPVKSNLWKEETDCLKWLDGKEPGSVVYVNFGSITVMSNEQLSEFAWGLAKSKCDFLWVIRNDLIKGDSALLPPEFASEISARALLTTWCPQEAVLKHPSIGGFLTHCGWNSTLESLSSGVPMICWPFFAEQQTNCRYVCAEWGVGMEIDSNVRRSEIEAQVREMMEGEKGEWMRKRAVEWKEAAIAAATEPRGSSVGNLERLVCDVLINN